MRDDNRKLIRYGGMASIIGIVLVISTFIGWAFGSWLDKKLGTDPWLMFIFTLMGITAGFIEMFRILKSITKD